MKQVHLALTMMTAENFAEYGELIDAGRSHKMTEINQGTAVRYDDIVTLDCDAEGGRVCVSVFVSQPRPQPIELEIMEKHPLGSQAFIPLDGLPFLVVVAKAGLRKLKIEDLHGFLVPAGAGVNLKRDVWHHPLLSLYPDQKFLILERMGPGENLAYTDLPTDLKIFVTPPA